MIERERWLAEVDAFVRQFAERAARWGEHPGDIEPLTPRRGKRSRQLQMSLPPPSPRTDAFAPVAA